MKEPIWTPTTLYKEESTLFSYMLYVRRTYSVGLSHYDDLYHWSISDIAQFWKSIFDFFQIEYIGILKDIVHRPPSTFIGTKWFEGIFLSYSQHIFKNRRRDKPAIIYKNEKNVTQFVSWEELENKVKKLQSLLLRKNVVQGDRVAGVLNNTADTVALFLAVNSIGAIWSCCSPDFGIQSIEERFEQIQPRILFSERSYFYNGKEYILTPSISSINLTSLQKIIFLDDSFWKTLENIDTSKELKFVSVPFDHPIWILFSSGTTGKPKAITHSTGGNLLEHLKALALHQNVQEGEKFMWYTTTGWMMWNYALSSLLCGATLVLYDGALQYPDSEVLWTLAIEQEIDHFGVGAAFLNQNIPSETEEYNPKTIGSTGSPLTPKTFESLQKIFSSTQIVSLSGGTDVCSAFLSGCPLLPVYAGEIQCRTLGSDIVSLNEAGNVVDDQIGELVIRQPMPSMPVCFWKDHGNQKYKESYFEKFDGLWCHGDWIQITETNGIIIYGRSDSTLNRGGVRIGTAEIYNILAQFEEIADSLALTLEVPSGASTMHLYVQMKEKQVLDERLIASIKQELRQQGSPRHVPDEIAQVGDIPYTINGKKLEIPVKKILNGIPVEKAVSLEIVRNPASFSFWTNLKSV